MASNSHKAKASQAGQWDAPLTLKSKGGASPAPANGGSLPRVRCRPYVNTPFPGCSDGCRSIRSRSGGCVSKLGGNKTTARQDPSQGTPRRFLVAKRPSDDSMKRSEKKNERVDTPSGAEPAACRTASSWREVAHKSRKLLFYALPSLATYWRCYRGLRSTRDSILRWPAGHGSSQGPEAEYDAVDPRFQAALLNPCLHSERPAEGMGYDTDTDVVKDKMLAFFLGQNKVKRCAGNNLTMRSVLGGGWV